MLNLFRKFTPATRSVVFRLTPPAKSNVKDQRLKRSRKQDYKKKRQDSGL
ncbi:hypothetical protein HanPI659440_Chr14g0569331 [Helianthus annuus]|nr:hypothetical protein HanPI659440_Chr14g0569331 [Helianthus annuus]